jgi:hypothetical protein
MDAPEQHRISDLVDDIVCQLGGTLGRYLILPKATVRTIDRFNGQAVVQVPLADLVEAGHTVRVEAITSAGMVPREPSGGSPIQPENVIRAEVMSMVQRVTELVLRQGRSREERRAVADYNQSIDAKVTELESMLKDWRAARPDAGFISGIERTRAACRMRMALRPKRGQQTDHVKLACARCAFDLMKRFSRHPISGSADSSFQLITARLYEAVIGEPDASCKRACESILREKRR